MTSTSCLIFQIIRQNKLISPQKSYIFFSKILYFLVDNSPGWKLKLNLNLVRVRRFKIYLELKALLKIVQSVLTELRSIGFLLQTRIRQDGMMRVSWKVQKKNNEEGREVKELLCQLHPTLAWLVWFFAFYGALNLLRVAFSFVMRNFCVFGIYRKDL